MNTKRAEKLSQAFVILRDYYQAKADGLLYSKFKLALANSYIDDICKYIDRKSGDIEKEFLFCCLGELDILKEEGNPVKISRFADAVHRVPYLFCGKEKWNKPFKEKYIIPFRNAYGNEWFEEVLSMHIPTEKGGQLNKRTVYNYNDINIMSLPGYFCFRMMIPLLTLPFLLGGMLYVGCSDYTETNHGEKMTITVESCEYENTDKYDYLYIKSKEHKEQFEVTRFFQYSDYSEKLIELCESGAVLVAYVEYKEPENSDNYYEIIQLEDTNGRIYRSYEHTNQMDRYLLAFLGIGALIIFIPFFVLFLLMLMVAKNPEKFASHPKFVKFCFPDYSLKR